MSDAAAVTEVTTTIEPEDEFAAMFAHLASGGDPGKDPADDAAKAQADADAAAAAQAQADADAAKAAAAKEGDAGTDDAAKAQADADAAAAAQADADAAKAAAKETPPPAPPEVTPPKKEAPPEPVELYTPAEKEEIATITKEWPDVERLFALKARQTQFDTLTLAFKEFNRIFNPVAQYVDRASTNEHTDALYEAHADYDAVYAPMQKWIAQQPAYLKKAYETVAAEGNADEVIDMISKFKKDTAWTAPAATAKPAKAAPVPAAAAKPAGVADLSEAARKAAGSMKAVHSKRGDPPRGDDPADFDAAWNEATKTN